MSCMELVLCGVLPSQDYGTVPSRPKHFSVYFADCRGDVDEVGSNGTGLELELIVSDEKCLLYRSQRRDV